MYIVCRTPVRAHGSHGEAFLFARVRLSPRFAALRTPGPADSGPGPGARAGPPGGEVATKVGYFGVKSAKVPLPGSGDRVVTERHAIARKTRVTTRLRVRDLSNLQKGDGMGIFLESLD